MNCSMVIVESLYHFMIIYIIHSSDQNCGIHFKVRYLCINIKSVSNMFQYHQSLTRVNTCITCKICKYKIYCQLGIMLNLDVLEVKHNKSREVLEGFKCSCFSICYLDTSVM